MIKSNLPREREIKMMMMKMIIMIQILLDLMEINLPTPQKR